MSLKQIENALDLHFSKSENADLCVAQILHTHANIEWLAQLHSDLISDSFFADSIAKKSYHHGNGFHKIVLLEKGYKLRLHIWLPGSFCEENIHDHRWSLASTVLTGQLRSEIWSDSIPASSNNAYEYIYHASKAGVPAHTEYKGPCKVERIKQSTRHKGEFYCMPANSMHRICNHGDQLVATLMCSSKSSNDYTRLITEQSNLLPISNPPRLNREQLLKVIDILVHNLH